jgi:type I restriction enzyme S subunit
MEDVLISKDGTLGVTRVVRTSIQFSIFVSVALVKPVQRECSDFLELAFSSPVVQRQMVGKGSDLQHIHLEDLRQDCIPLPSALEQLQIVTTVAEKLSQIDAAETQIEHGLLRASCLRHSILKQAFEGKWVPQDPNDEPASVLLERLRASRSDHEGNGKAVSQTRGRSAKSKQVVELPEK